MRNVSIAAKITGLVGFGLVALAATACGGDAPPPAAPPPPLPPVATAPPPPPPVATAPSPDADPKTPVNGQKRTMMHLTQAIAAHDAKKIASLFTENALIRFAGMPDQTGRDAIQSIWQRNFDAFPDSKGAATRVLVKNDVVIVEWVFEGTQKGDMGPIKATEKPIGVVGADVYWFTPEGLIKEQHTYMDTGTIMSQIGVSKQKARPIPPLPSGRPEVVISHGVPEETTNVDAANKMMGAFEKKSEADFVAGASDDIQWDDFTQPDTTKGKEAAKKYFKAMTIAFPDAKMSEQNVWGIGDLVVAEGTFNGTQKGPLFGIPAKNKPVTMHGLDIIQFRDGKAVRGWSYGNSTELAMQLGLIPKPGAAPVTTPAPKK